MILFLFFSFAGQGLTFDNRVYGVLCIWLRMSSDSDVLEEDDTFVQYGDNGELVFHREERASMEELLADAEDITSESDWSHHSSPQKPIRSSPEPTIEQQCSSRISRAPGARSRDSGCPVRECPFVGRKLKFHVQSEHLPRIVWDNPQPPIKEEKLGEWTEGRYQLLLFLSRALVGSERVEDLVRWAEEVLSPLVPVQSQILDQSQQQMRSLSRWMRWVDPGQFQLRPINSPSVLIHWRYQVLMAENLEPAQRLEFLHFGHAFMSNLDNVQSSVFPYALLHSSNARTLAGGSSKEPPREVPRHS